MAQNTYLGEYLVTTGVITQEELQQALQLQKQKGGYLGQLLVENGTITEQQLCQMLSHLLDIHWARIDCILIEKDVLRLVSKSLALTFHILPIFVHHHTLCLAMENPHDRDVIQFIESKTGLQVKPLLAPIYQLQTMIRKYYFREYPVQPIKDEKVAVASRIMNTSHPKNPRKKKIRRVLSNNRTKAEQKTPKIMRRTDSQGRPEISENQDIRKKRLGEVLVETGLITMEELNEALQVQKKNSGFLGKILVKMNMLSENTLCQVLSDLLYVESANLDRSLIHQDVVELIPGSLADTCRVLPLFVYDQKLYLAMENPLDPSIIQFMEFCSGFEVVPVIAPYRQLRKKIDKHYDLGCNEY